MQDLITNLELPDDMLDSIPGVNNKRGSVNIIHPEDIIVPEKLIPDNISSAMEQIEQEDFIFLANQDSLTMEE
jgi:hypothetical protein